MTRKKIPSEVEADVIYKSDRECVVCNSRGDHIHHIDGDNSNYKIENLALLCFDCHNEASLKGSLRKKLTAKTIIRYRDHKHNVVATNRENSLKVFISQSEGLTTEDILTTTKSAVIIIELEKIKEEYLSARWNNRSEIISKLHKFSEHTNYRLAVDIYKFLLLASDQTRSGMPTNVAFSIYSLLLDFFPYSEKEEDKMKTIELANRCTNIAFSLVYDSILYLKNFEIAMYGLTILKFIYQMGNTQKLNPLINKVNYTYKEIEEILQPRKRNDLFDALQLVKIFKADIKKGTLSFPPLPDNLIKIIYPKISL